MKKKKLKTMFGICALFVLCLGVQILKIDLNHCLNLPNDFYVSYSEIKDANNNDRFGKFVKLSLKEEDIYTGNAKTEEQYVVVKLFGLIPIRKIKARILPEEDVYVGGELIGLAMYSDGAVVISNCVIDENKGNVIKNNYFKNGDIISKINGFEIESVSDVEDALKSAESNVDVVIVRDNKKIKQSIPLIKNQKGEYKLGIWGKDDFSGVGTLTFVKQDNTFGALGHAITNGNTENIIPIKEGKVYSCSLVGVNKGRKNDPGELRCVIVPKNEKGEIIKNTKQGIYGKLINANEFVDHNVTASLGGRLSVRPGKAKIISCVSGIREEYEIEIIKANYQSDIDEKSIVFRVTDEKLLSITGGIVQGMSGSPIIQNDKVIGAVTHVFLNDPTKGYGVYTDWMLKQLEDISVK